MAEKTKKKKDEKIKEPAVEATQENSEATDAIAEELEAVKAELEKTKDMLLRTCAEFDNFK